MIFNCGCEKEFKVSFEVEEYYDLDIIDFLEEETFSSEFNIIEATGSNCNHNLYSGSYEITPSVKKQTLSTKNKLLSKDITVFEIPYYEVSNVANGVTIIIGGSN